jgi:2-polyprenyl-3-methyl-5-hydroxy-6-metoxy-1,4-benzoquinol methylase
MIPCPVCDHQMDFLFKTLVLHKYDVSYFQCTHCNFIQTEKPYWLNEAYASPISNLDIGLISRNMELVPKVDLIINLYFDPDGKFLDYGGGYGMMVRMMRDKGYHFYRQDRYCENLFARSFDLNDLEQHGKAKTFELLSAFEVFEHLENPLAEIEEMFSYSKNILFSTELQPTSPIRHPDDWWYFIPSAGQHIAFYSEKSLEMIAEKSGVKYYKISNGLHLFTANEIDLKELAGIEKNKLRKWFYYRYKYKARTSLLSSDFNKIIEKGILK